MARNEVVVSAYPDCSFAVQLCDDASGNFDPPRIRGYVTREHLDRVDAIVPDIEFRAIRAGSFDPRPAGPDGWYEAARMQPHDVGQSDPYVEQIVLMLEPPLIADAWYLDRLGLSGADRATLEVAGVISRAGREFDFVFPTEEGDIRISVRSATGPTDLWNNDLLMTPAFAREQGFDLFDWRYVGIAPAELTTGQQSRLSNLCCEHDEAWRWDTSIRQLTPTNGVQLDLQYQYDTWQPSRALLDAIIVTVALLLVGLVIAIGLSLSAVESRDERDTLTVLGARPRALRRLAALKAAVLVAAGGLLAIPAGFIPTWLVIAVSRTSFDDGSPRTVFDQFAFPWPTALGLVVVLPLIVGVGAWATSAIAQRFRPVRVSTMAFD